MGYQPISALAFNPRLTSTPFLSFSNLAWFIKKPSMNLSMGLFLNVCEGVMISTSLPVSIRFISWPASTGLRERRSGLQTSTVYSVPDSILWSSSLNPSLIPGFMADFDSCIQGRGVGSPILSASFSISLIWAGMDSACLSSDSIDLRQYITMFCLVILLCPSKETITNDRFSQVLSGLPLQIDDRPRSTQSEKAPIVPRRSSKSPFHMIECRYRLALFLLHF